MNLENLQIGENGYFFESKGKLKLSKDIMEEYFNRFIKHFDDYHQIFKMVRENIDNEGHDYVVSILVFTFSGEPNFLKETEEKETKYGYIIIVEYDNFIIVNKKNSINPNIILESFTNEIGYSEILNCFLKNDSQIQKLGIRAMDVSDHIIRKKVFEAKNLKNSLSIFHLNKYILGSLKINNGNEIFTINTSTSSIMKYSKKMDIYNYLEFCSDTITRLKNIHYKDDYLKNFPVTEETFSLRLLIPVGILIFIYEIFEVGEIDYIFYKSKKKKEISINQNRLISILSDSFEINNSNIINKYDKSFRLELSKNNKKYNVKSKVLNKIFIKYLDQPSENLLKIINRLNLYMVNFKQPEYSYSQKKIFKDSKLLGNIDSFMEIFYPIAELEKVKSENGKKEDQVKVSKNDTAFPKESIFSVIENYIVKKEKFLICDDSDFNEWADYIVFYDNCIQFMHAKYDKSKLSCQSLHVVVSQAQKNIGNLTNYINLEAKKTNNQKTKYDKINSKWEGTKIERLRRGKDAKSAVIYYNVLSRKINVQKEVALVINFISIKQLREELQKVKDDTSKAPQVLQMLWILSSLVIACKEAGLSIKIYACP